MSDGLEKITVLLFDKAMIETYGMIYQVNNFIASTLIKLFGSIFGSILGLIISVNIVYGFLVDKSVEERSA